MLSLWGHYKNQTPFNMERKKTPERFYHLTESKVLQTFHVKSIQQCTHLDTLLSGSTILTPFEESILDMALERYKELALGWNESDRTGGPAPKRKSLKCTASATVGRCRPIH